MAETLTLDRQKAVADFGGDEDMYLQFLQEWSEGESNSLSLRLHKGIMKEDFEEIRIGSHILISGAGYICAKRMYDLLKTLEGRGERKEAMNLIRKDYMELLHETRKAKREIATILKRPVPLNMADWDLFEKQVREAFPEDFPDPKASPICQGCQIF